jgi:photosystem II stability/assembly factor-like uncharacterized protein
MSESSQIVEPEFTSVCASQNGRFQTTVARNGYIYMSSDFGKTWSACMNDKKRNWSSVGMSESGQYQTAVTLDGEIYVSFDCARTWNLNYEDKTLVFLSLAVTGTGQWQVVVTKCGHIMESNNHGEKWDYAAEQPFRLWTSIALSAMGMHRLATTTCGILYKSRSHGVAWDVVNNLGAEPYETATTGAVSQFGDCMSAVSANGYIHVSTNYGHTWKEKMNDMKRKWVSISISDSGTYQTAVEDDGYIYKSDDSGDTWKCISNMQPRKWSSVIICGLGINQTAVSKDGCIYVSTDYGETWESREYEKNDNVISYKHGSYLFVLDTKTGLVRYIRTDACENDVIIDTKMRPGYLEPQPVSFSYDLEKKVITYTYKEQSENATKCDLQNTEPTAQNVN